MAVKGECNNVTRSSTWCFFPWNVDEILTTGEKNCPFQTLVLPSEAHYSGVPTNSVSEPAMKVSGYLQETYHSLSRILMLVLLLGCGVEGG